VVGVAMGAVKVAVAGLGFIGTAHVEALRRVPGVEVVAAADANPAVAEKGARDLAIPRVYSDWRELLRDPEIQVVHNCTPNHLHYEINKAIILAGKAVLSEKPLTATAAEATELVALARERKVVNAVSFNYRHYPMVQQARAMVSSGELGTVRLAYGHYLQDWLLYETDYNWRIEPELGGPSRAIADIGSHWCDTVQHVLGQRITRVLADVATLVPQRVRPPEGSRETFTTGAGGGERVPVRTEDYATVIVEFDGGVRGAFTVSQVSPGHKNDLLFELAGTRAGVRWAQEDAERLWVGRRDQPNAVLMRDPGLIAGAARPFVHYPGGHGEGWPDALKNQMLQFYTFLQQGGDLLADRPVFATFEDACYIVRIVEAILRSARTGTWADV